MYLFFKTFRGHRNVLVIERKSNFIIQIDLKYSVDIHFVKTAVVANILYFLSTEYLHRRIVAHLQETLVVCSNVTLCFLTQVSHFKRLTDH